MEYEYNKELKLFKYIDQLLEKKIRNIDLQEHFNKVEKDIYKYDAISILNFKKQVFQRLEKNDLKKIYNLADRYEKEVDVIIVGLSSL
jgi:hypothetical protein